MGGVGDVVPEHRGPSSAIAGDPGSCRYATGFNGSTSYLEMATPQFALTNQVTVMAWVRWGIAPASGDPWAAIVSNNSYWTPDYGQFWLQHSQDNSKFEFAVETTTSSNYVQSSAAPQQGQWQHVAGVYNGTTLTIYVNGVASGTASLTGNVMTPQDDFNLRIGRWGWDTAPRSFNGDIDEVRIYARSLSGGEVASAMAATHPCGASEPGAAHYLNVDEVTADNDASKISQPVTGAKDTQVYPGASVPAGAVVDSVSLRFAWKHDDPSHPSPAGPDMWALFRQNGVDSRGPTYQSTNAAGWVSGQWNMTVNPRTGQAWTLADANNGTEFGFEVYPTAGAWPHVTQAWVEVSYHTPTMSTVYIGGAYEKKSDGSVTKYYGALGRTIAVRQVPAGGGQGALYYPLADQLGSTSTLTDASGTVVATVKYWPYGGARSGGITQTDKLYTGQQIEPGDSALGLYDYKARFYSTTLGRFVSADSVTKDGLNRYSYARGNPVRYTDPTGQCVLGLKCSPSIALTWLACAGSVDGCATAFQALGLNDADPHLIEAVHRMAASLVKSLEFQLNYSNPDYNPYLNEKSLQSAFDTRGGSWDPLTQMFMFATPVVEKMLGLGLLPRLEEWLRDPYVLAGGVRYAAGFAASVTCAGTVATGGALGPGCALSLIVYAGATAAQFSIGIEKVKGGEMDGAVLIVDIAAPLALQPVTYGAPLEQQVAAFAATRAIRWIVAHAADLSGGE
jgi:RHS repeat-associated protein